MKESSGSESDLDLYLWQTDPGLGGPNDPEHCFDEELVSDHDPELNLHWSDAIPHALFQKMGDKTEKKGNTTLFPAYFLLTETAYLY